MEMEERLQEMGTKQSCCETSQASVRVNQSFEMFICLLAGTNKEEEEKMKETAKKKKKSPQHAKESYNIEQCRKRKPATSLQNKNKNKKSNQVYLACPVKPAGC